MVLHEITRDDGRDLSRVADLLGRSHKILVITGAGISTSCGIPDFRSKGGLYSLIPQTDPMPVPLATPPPSQSLPSTPTRKRKVGESDASLSPSQASSSPAKRQCVTSTPSKLKGKDLFDARIWKDPNRTSAFYSFVASLRTNIHAEIIETSQTHKWIRTLRDGGRLMRCYTQNIDGLEGREGLIMDLARGKGSKRRFMKKVYCASRPESISAGDEMDGGCEVVPLHGDLNQLRCNLCFAMRRWTDDDTDTFREGRAPYCSVCLAKSNERQDRGKRGISIGLLRPNIVLYNEAHPFEHLLAPLSPFDISQNPEILIVMGTSLTVHGLQKLVREFAKAVHARKSGGRVVFVNRTRPAGIWNEHIDDWISMDCDDWVQDLRSRREDLWLRQGELALPLTKPSKATGDACKKSAEGPSHSMGSRSDRAPKRCLARNEGVQTGGMVSINPSEQRQIRRYNGNKLITPEPDQDEPIRIPLTPPTSRGKSKLSRLAKEGPRTQCRSNTPWKEDIFDSPIKKRRIDIYEDEDSSSYERIKDVKSPIKREALATVSLSVDNISFTCQSVLKGNLAPEIVS